MGGSFGDAILDPDSDVVYISRHYLHQHPNFVKFANLEFHEHNGVKFVDLDTMLNEGNSDL